jgi:hypothetical protein
MEIEIDKEAIPYKFDMELGGELFTFDVGYNERFDFFTIGLEKDGEVIVAGEKVVLNQPLFYSLTDTRLPKVLVIPLDQAGNQARVNYDNLSKSVLLLVGEKI